MIRSFQSKDTANLFDRQFVKRFSGIQQAAYRRLLRLDAAQRLADLQTIPGNRVESLKGDRQGQYSIRINDQWRICFRWIEGQGAYDVEIIDYH